MARVQKLTLQGSLCLNAKVLEGIEFGTPNNHKDEWRDNQKIELQLEDKASRDARFEFKKYSCTSFINNYRPIHDLSIADPFNAAFLEGYVTLWEGILVSSSISNLISYLYSKL